jgi:hypothetical protein
MHMLDSGSLEQSIGAIGTKATYCRLAESIPGLLESLKIYMPKANSVSNLSPLKW